MVQHSEMTYKVVVNEEEQYSIWPVEMDTPLGWQELTITGSKDKCLRYIDEIWTDMRPASIR